MCKNVIPCVLAHLSFFNRNALHVSETHQDKHSPISRRMWVEGKVCTVGDMTRGSEPEVTPLEADIFMSTTKHSHW